jgi:hypothetical protein
VSGAENLSPIWSSFFPLLWILGADCEAWGRVWEAVKYGWPVPGVGCGGGSHTFTVISPWAAVSLQDNCGWRYFLRLMWRIVMNIKWKRESESTQKQGIWKWMILFLLHVLHETKLVLVLLIWAVLNFFAKHFKANFLFLSFFSVGLGFEFRTSHLQSRHSTAWVTPPGLFALDILKVRSHEIFSQAGLKLWSFWSQAPK